MSVNILLQTCSCFLTLQIGVINYFLTSSQIFCPYRRRKPILVFRSFFVFDSVEC
jgi:hypothetical protein